jgi:sugar phosphate isomerase/epimerase
MLSRRQLLATPALAAAQSPIPRPSPEPFSICAFSKHFHWTDVPAMAAHCAELGYEAIDLTVRPGGHVEPARVADDLPAAAEAIRKAGLRLAMATTAIADPSSPHAEAVIKALAAAGVRRYRWGEFKLDLAKPIPEQVDALRPRVRDLAALNRQYGVCAMYHTHSGQGRIGAAFWDLYLLLRGHSPDEVSANYDIGHATVEGGYGGWVHSSKLLLPHTRGIAVKDFTWGRNNRGQWVPQWCALGQGMVDFKRFFAFVKEAGFSGPLQLHMEYNELGGAASGQKTSTIPQEPLFAIFRRDLERLKGMLRESGLRA